MPRHLRIADGLAVQGLVQCCYLAVTDEGGTALGPADRERHLLGSDALAKAKSAKAMSESKGVAVLPENQSLSHEHKIVIHASRPRLVREGKR